MLLETSAIAVDRDGIPSELPPVEQLGRVFRAAGVDGRSRIVLYSADQQLAARAWFTLDYLGQGKRTSILDGGLAKWRADGGEVTQKASKPAAGTFESSVVPQDVTHLATLRELVRLRDQLGPNLVLIDARSPAQFDGVEAGPDVQHAGHIPSAVNVPSSLNFTADGTYRSPQDLLALYEHAGVTADSANVVYCRTGMSAAIPFFVLRYLGYDATLYDGSYVEWSKAGEPAEQ